MVSAPTRTRFDANAAELAIEMRVRNGIRKRPPSDSMRSNALNGASIAQRPRTLAGTAASSSPHVVPPTEPIATADFVSMSSLILPVSMGVFSIACSRLDAPRAVANASASSCRPLVATGSWRISRNPKRRCRGDASVQLGEICHRHLQIWSTIHPQQLAPCNNVARYGLCCAASAAISNCSNCSSARTTELRSSHRMPALSRGAPAAPRGRPRRSRS